jgi:DNA-binding Xre family transcriptional regulator
MDVSYKKLWKLLIDRDMKKRDLQLAAKLSTSTMSKLTHSQNMQMDVLVRICRVLDCDIGDIVEILPQRNNIETKDDFDEYNNKKL